VLFRSSQPILRELKYTKLDIKWQSDFSSFLKIWFFETHLSISYFLKECSSISSNSFRDIGLTFQTSLNNTPYQTSVQFQPFSSTVESQRTSKGTKVASAKQRVNLRSRPLKIASGVPEVAPPMLDGTFSVAIW